MADSLTLKTVETLMGSTVDTYNDQDTMLDLVTFDTPDPSKMQNSSNVIWEGVEQHAELQEGWDMTGNETGIIKEAYPAILGTPVNDIVNQRIDELRDMSYWTERGQVSGRQQATKLNTKIAQLIRDQGSLFYRSADTSGWDYISQAQMIMNERQGYKGERKFVLNDRSTRAFGSELAGRQTLQGRPEQVWKTGQLGTNIAEFDVFTGSFLPTLAGGADPAATISGAQSFAPEAGTVTDNNIVTNNDYRKATVTVSSSASFAVGDKITVADVYAIGLADKSVKEDLMTFTITAIPDSTSITIFPKPIAADDSSLSTIELAYANVSTTFADGAAIVRLNTDTSASTDLFFCKDAIKVLGGDIPAHLFQNLAGKNVITEKLANGLTMYMVFDGSILDMTFTYRLFTWYGVNMRDPSRAGCAVRYTA